MHRCMEMNAVPIGYGTRATKPSPTGSAREVTTPAERAMSAKMEVKFFMMIC